MNLISKRKFDLVILDVWLNNSTLDGIELLKLIKESYKYIPIVIISGHGNIEMAVQAIKEGAQEFIEKPFSTISFFDKYISGVIILIIVLEKIFIILFFCNRV